MTRDEIMKIARQEDLEMVRFLYIDNDGVIRGYCSSRECLEGDLDSGLAFAEVMPVFSALDNIAPGSAYGCTGELRGVPDLDTFRVLPYAEKQGQVICDFKARDHAESPQCARTVLKKVLASAPYTVKASFENEYYYAVKTANGSYRPFDRSLCFATPGMQTTEQVVLETARALRAQGIKVEKYYPEYGPGQQELVVGYSEGIRAADNQVIFRETVRNVAARHGIIATFMPRPFPGAAGSGGHMHVSLWEGERNLFYAPGDRFMLSDLAYHFIGGVLEHIRPLCAFTASTVTSYKRLVPHNWASAYSCYGYDNREAAVRISSGQKGREERTTNLEFKPVDGACNPYLALAALLAAGFDGINRRLDPGEAVMVDPDGLSPEEKEARGVKRLPRTLAEAAAALAGDDFFPRVFGEALVQEYVALKNFQWEEYHNQITDWEISRYMETY